MLKYLLIADVATEQQKESYYSLCNYLYNLNNHSEIYMVSFEGQKATTYIIPNGGENNISINSYFENKYEQMRGLCKNFIDEYSENDTVFILIDCCLVHSPLNNITFNQYYRTEYTYKLYEYIWEYAYENENVNWCCFSRGDNLLGFLSRALIQYKGQTDDRYRIKNLSWFYHKEEGNESKLEFQQSLVEALQEIE